MMRRCVLLSAILLAGASPAFSQSITGISPNAAIPGSAAIALTINGQFDPATGVTVYWDSTATTMVSKLSVTSFNAGQIMATIPATLLAAPDLAYVYLVQAGSVSNQVSFTVSATTTTLTSLSPNSTLAGSPALTMTVNGTNLPFGSASDFTVTWNGTPLQTTPGTSTQLTALVPASLLASPGTAQVTLSIQPQPTALTFTILSPLMLTSINPNTSPAGGPAITMAVNGSGFTTATMVTWNGTLLATTYNGPTLLSAVVPANLLTTPGIAQVNVAQSGLTPPAPLVFYIGPPPAITSLSPPSVVAGGAAYTLTVNGSGFVPQTVAYWNNVALPTTYVSANQLTATVATNLIAQPASVNISVQTASRTSNLVPYSVTIPPLTFTSISPNSAVAGSPAFTLTATGSNFTSSTSITWNGAALATSLVNATQLTATIPANLIASVGTAAVGVAAPGQTTPPTLPFAITPPFALTSLSPSSTIAGGPAFILTVNGTAFTTRTIIYWNGVALPTTPIGGSQASAAVAANLIAQPGSASITAQNGNQISNALTFTVTPPPPTLTSLSPNSTVAGGPAFLLTVNGTGFGASPVIYWNAFALSTTPINTGQASATVPLNLITMPGSASITVQNGNQASNALIFNITSSPLTLTSIAPTSAAAGGPAFMLTVNGTGFSANTTLAWASIGAATGAATPLATTFVSATQLTAAVGANLIAQPGSAAITAANGSLVSNSLMFSIVAPAPVITSVSPSSVTAGSASLSLTLAGSGFLTGAAVSFNGTSLATTFVSATQVSATVPANLIAQPGSAQITISNPNGPPSNAVAFTIFPGAPTITSIAPASALAGGPAFSLAVTGTGFFSGAAVLWNGMKLNTSFISGTQLSAAVTADLITQAGTVQVTATNNGSAASNAVTFTITSSGPTITSITPSTTPAGSAFTLTVTGTNFLSGATVSLNGTALATTFVSATQLTAAVPANLVAQAGTAQITAANPGGTASNAVTLTITTRPPALTSISPSSVTQGSATFILTVTGTGFVAGATAYLGTASLATTFLSNTQLSAVVTTDLVQRPGPSPVTVTNPGGLPSNPLPLTVTPPVPTITSLSPNTVQAGGAAFTLTVNGTNFLAGALVFLNSSQLNTIVMSPTQVTAQVSLDLIAQPGSAQITVANMGGAQSIAATLSITAAPPTITTISPVSAKVGDPTFTLSITGTGFVQASIAQWNGAPLSTTFVSSTQLTATIAAGRLILPATANVTVVNLGADGTPQVSNAVSFTINPVTPVISSISPNSATAGDPALSLAVNGTGLLNLTYIQWNSTTLNTHFVSATQVTADVPATLLAQAGTASVTAVNPGNNVSTALTFTINPRVPAVITSLSQTSATAGDPTFTLTVNGTGFIAGAVVNLGANALATTFVSATQLQAAVTANLLLLPNTFQIVVQQPGGASNGLTFTVNLPGPPSLRLTPPAVTGPAQQPAIDFGLNTAYPIALTGTVTLTFVSNATVPIDDPAIQFASGGRTMTFTVPANSTTLPVLQISTGTVAGTITIAVTLTAAGVNVTPSGSSATIVIAKAAPVMIAGKVKLVRAAGYVEVDITGFSTTRDMAQAVFHLNAAPNATFTSSDITVPLSATFTTWYKSAASAAFGSQFSYAQPFSVIGDTNQIQSITVTLTNSAGASVSMTVN